MHIGYIYFLLLLILLSGCAPNRVGMDKYYNQLEMISPEGDVFRGKVIFSFTTKDGQIEIPNSPLGDLEGNFSTTDTGYSSQSNGIGAAFDGNGNAIFMPTSGQKNIRSNTNYGNAFLKANGKVVLRCSLTLSFPWDSWNGTAFAVGGGNCLDNSENQYHLQFIKGG